ncbi:hypothetical protein XENOCAPTIV_028569, partial [Xenoophorus captivus]
VELRKKEQLLERRSEQLNVSKRVIAEQEEELAEVTKELQETERQNSRLRQSMEKMLEESEHNKLDGFPLDKDVLLRRLWEAEAEGDAAAQQVSALKEAVSKLCSAGRNRLSSSFLSQHKDLLLKKLETFEATNRTLRQLLREQQEAQNLERAANQQRAEMDHVTEQLNRLKKEALDDREALKRATRAQKQRAERSEDAAGQLSLQLLQMVGPIRISELTEQLQSVQDEGRSDREALLDRLRGVSAENMAAKLENQTLKAAASAVEEKLSLSQSELQQVKASIRQYETLLDSYKIQAEHEAQLVRGELEKEIEAVRRELLGRLSELEALPEALRRCQLQLQEAQDQERSQERQNVELSTNLTELRLKEEGQWEETGTVQHCSYRSFFLLSQRMCFVLDGVPGTPSGSSETEEQCADGGEPTASAESQVFREVRVKYLLLMETLRSKSSSGVLLNFARSTISSPVVYQEAGGETRERAATKERSNQSKIVELETQLSRTTSEIDQLRRRKEESRLQDLKDRLEQSDSTNRSLQNYVQFLKASYTNVFSDVALGGSLRAPSPV